MVERRNFRDRDSDGDRGDRDGDDDKRFGARRRKVSPFYSEMNAQVDYRNPQDLRHFITERGKILPRRISRLSSKHQRLVAKAVKRARMLGLLPFVTQG